MGDDLVSRLRAKEARLRSWSLTILGAPASEVTGSNSFLYEEAAAEIQRLRAALSAVATDNPNQFQTMEMLRTIARQALAAKAAGGDDGE